jgi:hypothetical protein
MRTSGRAPHLAAAAAVVALAAAPAVAPGQGNNPNPPKDQAGLTLDVRPPTIVFGSDATLSGRLSGTSNDRDVVVRFEVDDTKPYGDAYRNTALETRTGPSGNFALDVKPAVTSQYRAVAQASPPITSVPRLVSVRPRIGLRVSDPTPARGERVRFSGTVTPAHDGATVLIQRRSATGRFVTVARPVLRDATDLLSAYSRRIRIRRDGVYRVVLRGHADHATGVSRTRRIDVGG